MATTNAIKPLLTEENKRARIAFIVRFVDESTLLYSPMYDVIHLDEKWYYMTRASQRIYLYPIEPASLRYVRCLFNISNGCAVLIRVTLCVMYSDDVQARNISVVWCLAAVSWAIKDAASGTWFVKKLSVCSFVKRTVAQWTSNNRLDGAVKLKPVTSVSLVEYVDMLLDNVILRSPQISASQPTRRYLLTTGQRATSRQGR